MELLNSRFNDKIQTDLELSIVEKEDGIEIGQPEFYETFLYKIDVVGNDVNVSKSEHYVDDVNSLALDGIINSIIHEYIGDDNIETIN